MGRKAKREEVWAQLAAELGGVVATGRRGKATSVRFGHAVWTVVLDEYTSGGGQHSQSMSRVRARYRTRDDFRFRVYRRTPFSGLGRMLGMQDIEVGSPDLDRDYIVKSNSPGKIQALLLPRDVSRPLAQLRTGSFQNRKPQGRDGRDPTLRELVYMRNLTREPEALRAMVDLIRAALDHLVRIGAARQETAEEAPS